MKLRRLVLSSSQRLPSSMSIGTPWKLIFNVSLSLPARSLWVASQPSIRMFCRCSNPTMVGEIDENANSTNWKNNLYTVKPKKSNNLVKPRLKGNWKWATIVRKYQCAKGMWTVELRADGVLKEFRKPGQYIQVKQGDSMPCYFAIANSPGHPRLELLVKEKASTKCIIQASEGSDLQIGPVIGKGFPIEQEFFGQTLEDCPVGNIIIMCTGSGIAPIKSVIESKALEFNGGMRGHAHITIYYGCSTPDDMAYVDQLKLWENERSIVVVPVMSEAGKKEGWTGRTGFVQDALLRDGIDAPWDTGGLLVGQKDMVRHGRAILEDAGVSVPRSITRDSPPMLITTRTKQSL